MMYTVNQMQHQYKGLDDVLGQELGRNPYGEPLFRWAWSEDLLWMATRTGRMITQTRKLEVPIIVPGEIFEDDEGQEVITEYEKWEIEEVVPEYSQNRLTRQTNTWFMSKWLSPRELILGTCLRRGIDYDTESWSQAQLVDQWTRLYPGADFPSQGWRIPTDASLPRAPGGNREPNWPDTEYFIHCVKKQTRSNAAQVLLEMDNELARDETRRGSAGDDELRDLIPAFANPSPGKRGGFLSLPFTRWDRLRG